MLRQRALQYFFIIAAVISILDGAFSLQPTMQSIKYILLVVSGLLAGMLLTEDHDKIIISGISYVVGVFLITQYLGSVLFFSGIQTILMNFSLFVGMVLVVVGIERFVGYMTSERQDKLSLDEELRKLTQLGKKEIKKESFEKIWGTIILVAVGFTFVIILAELFFTIGRLAQLFWILDLIITVLFIIDVIILYVRSKSFGDFLRNHVFDILSAIPLVGVLRGLKIIRAVKIIKSTKMLKVIKAHKTTKFFSEKSSFNKVKNKKDTKAETHNKNMAKKASVKNNEAKNKI